MRRNSITRVGVSQAFSRLIAKSASDDDLRGIADDIYERFAQTQYGKKLETLPRYGRHVPTGWTVDRWEALIGPNGNNLHHMAQSIIDARRFVMLENAATKNAFSPLEGALLEVTGAMHDQGEYFVGDIQYQRKPQETFNDEQQHIRDYELQFAPGLSGIGLTLYRVAYEEIAFGDLKKKLPAAQKAIELMGFIDDTLLALDRLDALRRGASGREYGLMNTHDREIGITVLECMTTEILASGVFGRVIELGGRFPGLLVFLRQHALQIDAAMGDVRDSVFEWYDSHDSTAQRGEKVKRLAYFYVERENWKNWMAKR